MPEIKSTCETCPAFDLIKDGRGYCRKNAPIPRMYAGNPTDFPQMFRHDWCMEHPQIKGKADALPKELPKDGKKFYFEEHIISLLVIKNRINWVVVTNSGKCYPCQEFGLCVIQITAAYFRGELEEVK